jgi:PAS domain S-box-containing protein
VRARGAHRADLSEQQQVCLRALGRQVLTQLELRRSNAEQTQEIERRRQIETALVRSRREYQLLAEHSGDIVARYRLDGTVLDVSSSLASELGYAVENQIGLNVFERMEADGESKLRAAFETVRAGGSNGRDQVVNSGSDGERPLRRRA